MANINLLIYNFVCVCVNASTELTDLHKSVKRQKFKNSKALQFVVGSISSICKS